MNKSTQSSGDDRLVRKVEEFFHSLRAETIGLIDEFYAPEALFEDPVGTHRGLDAIRAYYAGLYQNVTAIRFDFGTIVKDGSTVCAPWRMFLRATKLNRGNEIALPGISYITFDIERMRATYHRDYFDMGSFIYEHVPVLGSVVRYAKRRLRPETSTD